MQIKGLFKKNIHKNKINNLDSSNINVPDGLYTKCPVCSKIILTEDMYLNNCVCPECGYYMKLDARTRISMVVDKNTFSEWDTNIEESNPCEYPGYEEKIQNLKRKTNLDEAVITGVGKIDGSKAVIGVCDTRFLMGSMGEVVGEKLTRAVEKATEQKLPVIIFTCSGGARMQEGIVSLMQMAKTSAALKRHHEAGQLFISVLTDPTTGGVTASFAMLGDIILAEPHALIGFAGPRVIEQTIGQKLPEGFQRSEFLLEHGFVDKIVERKDQKRVIGQILYMHRSHKMNIELKSPVETARTFVDKPSQLQADSGKTAWDTVLLSRKSDRPVATDYINALFDEFIEFHGDRYFKDDGAIVGGVAMFHGMPVTVIGQQKGKNTKDNIIRNFGMPSPDGYRKALRLMKQAETFNRPVICFVDTPGAFCGLEAEERGQGEAIARNLFEISDLKVPVLSIVIGEGGSGGALAMAVADEVWMLENAIYSILSPEGFASILYKDSKKAPDAAKVMKVTAKDLLQLELIERIVPEEEPACTDNLYRLAEYMDSAMAEFFKTYLAMSDEELREHRYQRFRRM